MKLTTQTAVVICFAIVASCALVLGLAVYAHWSDGAVVGLIAAVLAGAGTLIVQLRNHRQTADSLTQQDRKLETIERQTNGLSDIERQDIAARAAEAAIAKFLEAK